MFGMFESKPDIKKMAAERDIKGLLETLQNQNKKFARERADAAKVLRKLKDPRATKPLVAMLNHPEEMIRSLVSHGPVGNTT